MHNYPWLPKKLSIYDFSSETELIDYAYDLYCKDFIDSHPIYSNEPVKSKRYVAKFGKDHSFFHCIEEKIPNMPTSESNRRVKIELCERIVWARPTIEHCISDQDVFVWEETFHKHGTKLRTHIFLVNENYMVVLEKRTGYYYLWTTFLVDSSRRKQQIFRRYQKSIKDNK